MDYKKYFIRENPRQITEEVCNGIPPIKYLYSDAQGHDYWAFKCPQPECQNFFTAREDNVRTRHVSSCGCLKRKRGFEWGYSNHKGNPSFFVAIGNYWRIFYNNYDGYFIIDDSDYPEVKKHTWTGIVVRNKVTNEIIRINPVTTIDGFQIGLSKFLLSPPAGKQVDHQNQDTNDFRRCNLRILTQAENLNNRPIGQGKIEKTVEGKYRIINFHKEDVSQLLFDSHNDAKAHLEYLRDKHMGTSGYYRSQEDAKKHKIHEFVDITNIYDNKFYDDNGFDYKTHCSELPEFLKIVREIDTLPNKSVFKNILHNIIKYTLDGNITPINGSMMLDKLVDDYKNSVI